MTVLKGACRPLFVNGPFVDFQKLTLWIMPPFSIHSWKADPAQPCEVIVAHFAALPQVMTNFISYTRPTVISLSSEDILKISHIYDELLPDYSNPQLKSLLVFEKSLADYCLIIIKHLEKSVEVSGFDADATKVQQILSWYQEHLEEGPKVADTAAALNISESHMRRIFDTVMGQPPKEIFQQLGLDKACRLMSETSMSLKEISFKCGYRGFSQFYRAFRLQYQQSPEAWRKNSIYGNTGIKTVRIG